MNDEFRLPDDFLIGTANSAFQSEGAWNRDGKSESIMDYYAKECAGKAPGATETVRKQNYSEDLPTDGCLFYDNYEAYIDDMKETGQNVYRMSLAWPRIIPTGVGDVNPLAIEHYNKVINKLIECGITPFVDLYHWDMPMCLQKSGGFANPSFPEWFEAYSKVCFEAFGDRVKFWSTFNESAVAVMNGYVSGRFPPFQRDGKNGLIAAHNVILAHYRAVKLYKQMGLGGQIGSVNCITDMTAASPDPNDAIAARIRRERQFDWWAGPMFEGKYPQFILDTCDVVRADMPEHYQEDLDKWFVPMDFIGLNYYIANRVKYDPKNYLLSSTAENYFAAPGQLFIPYPSGLIDVVQYVGNRYKNVPMYITENGCAIKNQDNREQEINDPLREDFIREHLRNCVRLIREGYNLKGYMYWNDADSYEELEGYRLRFGLTWVDHETGEKQWKNSRYYFSKVCKSHIVF